VARRRGANATAALADIWASTEEVQYERRTNLVDLEADDVGTKIKKKKKKPPIEFYYRDNTAAVQGPFSKEQMRGWIDAGYFPPTTKARTNRMDPDGWVPMGDLPALRATATKDDTPSGSADAAAAAAGNNDNSVQDRIAALKGNANDDGDSDSDGDSSMQARIAAMRADLSASSGVPDTDNNNDDPGNDIVQDRIAALRANNNNDDPGSDIVQDRIAALRADANDAGIANCDEDEDSGVDPAMQARIAAMKADLAGSASAADQRNEQQHNRGDAVNDLQDRIAALRNNAPPPPPPPPAAYPIDGNKHAEDVGPSAYPVDCENDAGVAAYPVDDEDSAGVAAYPIDADNYATGVASYPVDGCENEEAGVTGYPVGDGDGDDDDQDGVAAYPVSVSGNDNYDDEGAVAPYPTDDPYPGGEDLAYPVTDSYPVDDEYDDVYAPSSYDVSETSAVPAKKVVKVDKALVSFIPTNLQNKKRKVKKESDGNTRAVQEQNKKIKSAAKTLEVGQKKVDDYDKFMGEIDGL